MTYARLYLDVGKLAHPGMSHASWSAWFLINNLYDEQEKMKDKP